MSGTERIISLCEELGYGEVMRVASKGWQKKLTDKYGSEWAVGAFIPALLMDIKKSAKKRYENDLYKPK